MSNGLSVRSAINAAEKERGRKYTTRQKKFLTLYANNNFQDSMECAIKAGYKTNTYTALINSLKEDIKDIATSMLLGAAPVAAMALTNVLGQKDFDPSSPSKISAAKEILDRVGIIRKTEVQHEHKVSGGLFIIPAKAAIPEQEVIDGEYEEYEYLEDEA